MAKIENKTLKTQCERICKLKDWATQNWDSEDSAIVVVRTILEESGDKELLADTKEAAEHRRALVKAISPLMTAAVNFRRQYLVPEKLSPEMGKADERTKEYA